MKRQLAAHGDCTSIAICQTNTPATHQWISGNFHNTSTFLFISSNPYVLENPAWEAPM